MTTLCAPIRLVLGGWRDSRDIVLLSYFLFVWDIGLNELFPRAPPGLLQLTGCVDSKLRGGADFCWPVCSVQWWTQRVTRAEWRRAAQQPLPEWALDRSLTLKLTVNQSVSKSRFNPNPNPSYSVQWWTQRAARAEWRRAAQQPLPEWALDRSLTLKLTVSQSVKVDLTLTLTHLTAYNDEHSE